MAKRKFLKLNLFQHNLSTFQNDGLLRGEKCTKKRWENSALFSKVIYIRNEKISGVLWVPWETNFKLSLLVSDCLLDKENTQLAQGPQWCCRQAFLPIKGGRTCWLCDLQWYSFAWLFVYHWLVYFSFVCQMIPLKYPEKETTIHKEIWIFECPLPIWNVTCTLSLCPWVAVATSAALFARGDKGALC